jgi:hypothetical protein
MSMPPLAEAPKGKLLQVFLLTPALNGIRKGFPCCYAGSVYAVGMDCLSPLSLFTAVK